MNASNPPAALRNCPTAVQFPADPHDTEVKRAFGVVFWTPEPNTAGVACPHTPAVDVIVNASNPKSALRNRPTAVQFPTDPHDTEVK